MTMGKEARARVYRGLGGWWYVTLSWVTFPRNTSEWTTFERALRWANMEVYTEREKRWPFHG